MGAPPFIYDKTSSYTFGAPTDRGFNPRAATQASWAPRVPKSQKKDGPLIDFNRHPDSYLVVPYQSNLNVQPMHPNTRYRVRTGRRVQLFLRICALLGALGSLFCCIAINKTSSSIGWIIRVAPAVALVHSVYGVYHLCRAAQGRTPASTASYMVFAAVVDTGLIPFFAFSAYLSYLDYTKNEYGWGTLFNDNVASYNVIYAFFLLNATEGGISVISLFLDVYLGTLFRRIAKLPPDMNPLEPNLTSRHHKRNKSSMNVTEKHMSSSTLANQRDSGIAGRRVPFIHTRTDSADSVTLYGNDEARNSRISMRKDMNDNEKDPYRQSNASFASSRVTLAPTRPTSAINPPSNARAAGAGLDYRPERSSALASSPARPSSWLSYLDYEGVPAELSQAANQELDKEVRPMSPVSAMSSHRPSIDQQRTEQQNWYQGQSNHGHLDPHNQATLAPPAYDMAPKKRSREPLGMNPPTPPIVQQNYHQPIAEPVYHNENLEYDPYAPGYYGNSPAPAQFEAPREALTPTNANAHGRSSRPSSFIGSGGKSRFYGDLRASIGSMHAEPHKLADDSVVEIHADYHSSGDDDKYERTQTMQSASDYSGNIQVYGSEGDDEQVDQYVYQPQKLEIGTNPNMSRWSGNGARQVSNSTGHDLHASYAGLGEEFGRGMARRREVSGKVVEEGRSPFASPVQQVGSGPGAAGWARFKGL